MPQPDSPRLLPDSGMFLEKLNQMMRRESENLGGLTSAASAGLEHIKNRGGDEWVVGMARADAQTPSRGHGGDKFRRSPEGTQVNRRPNSHCNGLPQSSHSKRTIFQLRTAVLSNGGYSRGPVPESNRRLDLVPFLPAWPACTVGVYVTFRQQLRVGEAKWRMDRSPDHGWSIRSRRRYTSSPGGFA